MDEEKIPGTLLEVKQGIGEKTAEFMAGIWLGITSLLLFGLVWILIFAVLLAEWRWLIHL
jgi:hypothetical protein